MGWYEITTIPKGVKLGTQLNKGGKRLGIVPAKSPKQAINRYCKNHRCPNQVRVFPVRLVK